MSDNSCQIVINGYKACLGGMLLKHHGVASDDISVVVTLDEQRMRAKLARKLMVRSIFKFKIFSYIRKLK